MKLDTRVTTLGHTQRGGKPCSFDRNLVGPFPFMIVSDFINNLKYIYTFYVKIGDASRC